MAPTQSASPSVFTAIQEQLGLKVERQGQDGCACHRARVKDADAGLSHSLLAIGILKPQTFGGGHAGRVLCEPRRVVHPCVAGSGMNHCRLFL